MDTESPNKSSQPGSDPVEVIAVSSQQLWEVLDILEQAGVEATCLEEPEPASVPLWLGGSGKDRARIAVARDDVDRAEEALAGWRNRRESGASKGRISFVRQLAAALGITILLCLLLGVLWIGWGEDLFMVAATVFVVALVVISQMAHRGADRQ